MTLFTRRVMMSSSRRLPLADLHNTAASYSLNKTREEKLFIVLPRRSVIVTACCGAQIVKDVEEMPHRQPNLLYTAPRRVFRHMYVLVIPRDYEY